VLVLIGSYLLLVFVLPVALSAVVSYRSLPHGRSCPYCRADTIPLLAPRLRLLNAFNPFGSLQRRWCLDCGWEGITRVTRRPPADASSATTPVSPATAPARSPEAPPTQTLDVCSLNVDGAPWRVMLQCWSGTGLYYGRFVFVAPSGRLWLDAVEAFRGADEREVLGQALSLPERLLESRLRRLVADR
jgi:hypothetical protein